MSNKHTCTHAQTWIARQTEKGRDCDPVECYCTDDVWFLFAHLKIHLYFSQMFCTFYQWRAPHTLITKQVDLSISRNGKKNYEFQNKWDSKITPTDQTEMNERKREREKHETPFSNVWRRNLCNFLFLLLLWCFYLVLLWRFVTISISLCSFIHSRSFL